MKQTLIIFCVVAMVASCKKTTQVSDMVQQEEELYEIEDTCDTEFEDACDAEIEEPNDTLSIETLGKPVVKVSNNVYKGCGTFKHFSFNDTCPKIVKTKKYTDSIEHKHVLNLDLPLKISFLTKEDLSNLQKSIICALFGKEVKSSDVQKVLAKFMENERKEHKTSILDFRFEKRQGNFLVFKEEYSYSMGFEADVDSREYTFLYNIRTKKVKRPWYRC